MDVVLQGCQRLQFWWKCQESLPRLEEGELILEEILKFLGTVALIATTGLFLLMAG
jgi:hypothetical protein